jgi:alkaline phosphatase D
MAGGAAATAPLRVLHRGVAVVGVRSGASGHAGGVGWSCAFAHGVASFDPTATGVLLWTRLDGDDRTVSWVVASDPKLSRVVSRGEGGTGPERDFTLVVDVDGLEPATTYWYRFRAGGHDSPVGRTRTLPAGQVERFRIATVSCAHFAEAPLGVYRAVAEREVDLVVHLGDYIYEEAAARRHHRAHEPPRETVTLEDYRRRIGQIRTDPDAQALHLRHPMAVVWDDHDFCDNAWRDGAKKHDPARHGPWAARVAAAVQAHHEWLPSRLRRPDDPMVTSRSLEIGDLAELILLDTRLVGRDRQAGDDGAKALDDANRSLLGDEQRRWLDERLADVRRPWALVVSGVVVNEIELPWPRPLAWVRAMLPSGYAVLDGRVMHDDQWDGYPVERSRLVERLAERAGRGARTVLLSGDVHSSWAFNGPIEEATGEATAVELTTPAVASAAMGRARYPALWRLLDRAANSLNHVVWAEVTNRGYAVIEVTTDAVRADFHFVHPYDDDPGGRSTRAAGFTTRFGDWPPRLAATTSDPPPDPARPQIPGGLPPRPSDLPAVRRRRRIRIAAKSLATTVVAATVVAATAGLTAAVVQRRPA